MKAIEWLDDFMRRTPFGQFIKVLHVRGNDLWLFVNANRVSEFGCAPIHRWGVRGGTCDIYAWSTQRQTILDMADSVCAVVHWSFVWYCRLLTMPVALFVGIPLPPPEDSKGIDSRLILLTSNWLNVSSETPFRLLIVVGISAMSALFLVPTSPSQRGNPHKRFWGSE